jgi:UDP-N-acetylmuramoyl-L-alanyl-D-glutamate--2,6-diaminopimelate ligase
MVSYIIAHGASAIIVDEEVKYPPQSNCLIIRTKSSRRALAYAFSAFSYHPQRKLKIYGITGTTGKTSTAVFLEAILRRAGLRTALIGTLGCFADGRPYTPKSLDAQKRLTTMTTPDPDILYPFLREIANLNITHVVMEVSSHALALEKVAPIHFEGAGFTNFSMEHMDFHLTPEAYLEAKRILFHQTKKAAINIDDSAGEKIAKSISCPTLTCGIVWNADVMASEIEMLPNGTHRFMIAEEQTKDLISLSCLGEYQIYNALLAATMAKQACISGKAIREGIESVSSIPGRFEVITTPDDPVQICIDFAHTEASLRNLLKAARSILSGDGRLILVFGCGGDRDKTKRAPMGACAEELADFSIITSDNARTESPTAIISDILCGYRSAESRKVIVDRQKAIEYAIEFAHDGDCILVVGKGHEQYEIRGGQILPFDERKIILSALKQRKNANTMRDNVI